MSVNVTNNGDIIESRNYLSNYFVTLNSDQTINGNKTFNSLNVSTLTVQQINSSALDISTNNLTLNGDSIKTLETIFGSVDISENFMVCWY